MSHKIEMNKLEKHYWVWPIAIYLFLGGLGGGMLFVAGIMDLLFGYLVTGFGSIFAVGVFGGVVCLGLGCFLLVFELGQPKVFLRVFLSGTAIIKYGACLLLFAMVFGFIYCAYFLPTDWDLFYYEWIWLRDLSCALMMIFGLGVMVYTGVFLASMKAKAFWNSPALPVLFTISAISTATALLAVLAGMWPMPDVLIAVSTGNDVLIPAHLLVDEMVGTLHFVDSMLVITEIIVLLVYVIMLRAAGNVTARAVASKWLQGGFSSLFWGGMIILGLLMPFLLYRMGGASAEYIAPALVLSGGLLLRFMVVFSDQRRPIPGEKRYWKRLPKGNELFLKGWKAPY